MGYTISHAIDELTQIQGVYGGDIELHMEIGNDEDCCKCGQSEYQSITGTCRSIGHINVDGQHCAWLIADKD